MAGRMVPRVRVTPHAAVSSRRLIVGGLWGVIALTGFASCDEIVPDDPEPSPPPPPGYVLSTPFATRSLNDVVVLEADEAGITSAYAVGTDGTILHYNGLSWGREDAGIDVDLEGVGGVLNGGGEVVIAVGADGTAVIRRDGTWAALPTNTTRQLFGVWVRTLDDAWIVGDRGTVLRFDGEGLTQLVDEVLLDTGAVDENGDPVAFPISDPLKSVQGRGADEVFTVGPRGVVYRYDGTRFQREASETNRPLTDVFTGGGVWAAATDGVLLRRRGDSWNDSDFVAPIPIFLQSIWARGDGDVFAVGLGEDVFQRSDGVWTGTAVGDGVQMRAIDGAELPLPADAAEDAVPAREILAVGAGGRIVRGPLVEPRSGEVRLRTRTFEEE